MFDPSLNIDEIELRINHYYKMQEAIRGTNGAIVFSGGLARSVLAFYFISNHI